MQIGTLFNVGLQDPHKIAGIRGCNASLPFSVVIVKWSCFKSICTPNIELFDIHWSKNNRCQVFNQIGTHSH